MRVVLFALLMVGCGNNNMMNTSPLVGVWKANITDGSLTFTFRGDNTYDQLLAGLDAMTHCNTTVTFTGTWSSTPTTFSTVATSGHLTATGCTDTTMNMDRAANPQEISAYSLSGITYTISGNMLTAATVSGMSQTFTKQ